MSRLLIRGEGVWQLPPRPRLPDAVILSVGLGTPQEFHAARVLARLNDTSPSGRRPQPLLEQQMAKSQGEKDDMYEPISPDDLVRKEWTDRASCPADILATLLPYQAEGCDETALTRGSPRDHGPTFLRGPRIAGCRNPGRVAPITRYACNVRNSSQRIEFDT